MNQEITSELSGAIAIIGMAGRFPQARDLEAFWQNLIQGKEVVSFFSKEELKAAGVDEKLIDHPSYVPARAILENAEDFDAAFFGYSPREADVIDPQHRLFLECAWVALENAGYDPERTNASVGVFGGTSMNTYLLNNILANPEVLETMGGYQIMLGNDKDFLTTRVSYKLNLKGPSINLQTACSTSLVAVQQACQSLLNYQCDMALAGGVSASSPRIAGYLYQPGMIMSPDGHCRAFDHKSQGIVAGEGVGIVVLKRYAEAINDGDTIHAVIRGSAINNDGALKVGYTAPSVDGQTDAIMMAQAVSGVAPETVTYVETHGTGTELGDPIEISALAQAFDTGAELGQYCAIGSVKTNMGHLDAAAGIAGLLKTVLALKHKKLPPSLHFEKPNPRIDFSRTPFYVNTSAKDWLTNGQPRRAGVSSFGIGGTNAHVVLEEAPVQNAGQSRRREQVLLLSARSEGALNAASSNLAAWLRQNPAGSLADTAYTLHVGRKVFKNRRVVISATSEEAAAILENPDGKLSFSDASGAEGQRVVFLFPGQGAQYVNMGKELYESEPVFREQVDLCAEILKPHIQLDLRDVLYPTPEGAPRAEELLQQTWITQPALFTIEYALAKMWMAWGIQPQAMLGHSIGEYTAACLAGVFSLEDGLALVAARGKMMQSLPGGSMLSVPLSESDLRAHLNPQVTVAAVNAPKMSVVSGPDEAIDRLQKTLAEGGIACRKLHTSHAFHSMMMDPILDPFTRLAAGVTLHPPQIPYLSNLSGDWITPEQATSPNYWADHLRSTVRFGQNIEAVGREPGILLEVGPGQTLGTLARQQSGTTARQVILASMRHPQDAASDSAFLAAAIGRLWLAGASLDWKTYHAGEMLHRIPLPTYPFEYRPHWIDSKKKVKDTSEAGEIKAVFESARKELTDWFYLPTWQRSAWPASVEPYIRESAAWLIFADALGVGEAIALRLRSLGKTVSVVKPGEGFAKTGDQTFVLHPERKEDYSTLFTALSSLDSLPTHILHLWTLTQQPPHLQTGLGEQFSLGFYSLMALAQAFGDMSNKKAAKMLVISNHQHEVTGGEQTSAAKSLVIGPSMVISQEYPDLYCRSVEIANLQATPAAVDHLLAEFTIDRPEPVVAHRENFRWVKVYTPNPLPEADFKELPLRQRGAYLITGGYGGIGLTLANALAQSVQANLVLVGRSGLPERQGWQAWLDAHGELDRTSQRIRAVQNLEQKGAAVLCLQADAADLDQMRGVLSQAKERFGRLDGVIHAAGIAGGGIIQLKTREQAAAVLDPKVEGVRVLDLLLADNPPDFLLLCSSINAVAGGAGQVDYSTANGFMDAYANQKTAEGSQTRVLSIDWTAWQEVGMAVDAIVPAQLQQWKEENLRSAIRPTEGWEALSRVFNTSIPQMVVSPKDLAAIIALAFHQNAKPETTADGAFPTTEQESQQAAEQPSTRPVLPTAYHPPSTDIETTLVRVWENLIGIHPVGIHDNFFELGGHSLLATQILSRIRDLYQVELPLKKFFEVPTIAELGKQIEAIHWVEQNRDTAVSDSSDREEIEL